MTFLIEGVLDADSSTLIVMLIASLMTTSLSSENDTLLAVWIAPPQPVAWSTYYILISS